MLSGDNGILQRATDAKTNTDNVQIREKIRLAYSSALTKDISNQKAEVQKSTFEDELEVEFPNKTISITESADKKKWVVTIDSVTENVPIGKDTPTVQKVADHKDEKFSTNTELEDDYGNKITVPKGFKITTDSPNVVTAGIIIEDATYTNTLGSQFVWVPVGAGKNAIKKNAEGTETIEIALDRYVFIDDNWNNLGIPTPLSQEFVNINGAHYYFKNTYTEETTFREGNRGNNTNATAKELLTFISSVGVKGGFYIGRYEARTAIQRTSSTPNDELITDSNLTQITEKQSDYVYNYVTQLQAAKLSREMYSKDNDNNNITEFASDLINSYAWDTATLFLQKLGEEGYSIKSNLNTSSTELAERGTLLDHPCNIYDMASNCIEWTTETCADIIPCISRGGTFVPYDPEGPAYSTSGRYNNSTNVYGDAYTFRPVLYVR